MSQAVGNLIVNLIANTGKYTAGLQKAQAASQQFKSNVTKALTFSIGGIALGAGIKKALNDFAESELAAARLQGTLRATGNEAGLSANRIQQMAGAMSRTTIFDDDAIIAASARLASFGNISADTFDKAMRGALDLSSALGTDLDSAAMALGKALENPAEGLAGLSRMGIRFSDAQEKVIAGMMAVSDVAGAQGFILDALQKKFGGLAEAVGSTTAGRMKQLANEVGNVWEAVGQRIAESGATDVMKTVTQAIRPENLGQVMELGQLPKTQQDLLDQLAPMSPFAKATMPGNLHAGDVAGLRAEMLKTMESIIKAGPSLKGEEFDLADSIFHALAERRLKLGGLESRLAERDAGFGQQVFGGGQVGAGVNRITGMIGGGATWFLDLAKGADQAAMRLKGLADAAAVNARLMEHQQDIGRGIQGEIAGMLRTPESDLMGQGAKIAFARRHGLITDEAADRAAANVLHNFSQSAYQPIGNFERGSVAEFSERKRLEAENNGMKVGEDQLKIQKQILAAIERAFADPKKNVEDELTAVEIR